MATVTYSVDENNNAIINVGEGICDFDLDAILFKNAWDVNNQNLTIQGAGVDSTKWVDFCFVYYILGSPSKLILNNLTLETISKEHYAIYKQNTEVTLTNVNVNGYKGEISEEIITRENYVPIP